MRAKQFIPAGPGTVFHPVTGSPITTECVEQVGFGVIGEYIDRTGEGYALKLLLAAPTMEAALARILVLVQQGVDDTDLEAIESECRDALGQAWGVPATDVWTPDLDDFRKAGST